jgi:hypothetical protein
MSEQVELAVIQATVACFTALCTLLGIWVSHRIARRNFEDTSERFIKKLDTNTDLTSRATTIVAEIAQRQGSTDPSIEEAKVVAKRSTAGSSPPEEGK